MSPRVIAEIARLPDMKVSEFQNRCEQVLGDEYRSRNKQYLIRRIAWRLHANTQIVAPEPAAFVDWEPRLPPPNNIIQRQYKGEMIRVVVL